MSSRIAIRPCTTIRYPTPNLGSRALMCAQLLPIVPMPTQLPTTLSAHSEAEDGAHSRIGEGRALRDDVRIGSHLRGKLGRLGMAEIDPAAEVQVRPDAPHRAAVHLTEVPVVLRGGWPEGGGVSQVVS